MSVREAAKKNKVIFLVARALKSYPSPPETLVATFFGDFLLVFFLELQKKLFFLSGQALIPHLVAGPLKKTFFAASLLHRVQTRARYYLLPFLWTCNCF